jgi:hypothetical protein
MEHAEYLKKVTAAKKHQTEYRNAGMEQQNAERKRERQHGRDRCRHRGRNARSYHQEK